MHHKTIPANARLTCIYMYLTSPTTDYIDFYTLLINICRSTLKEINLKPKLFKGYVQSVQKGKESSNNC